MDLIKLLIDLGANPYKADYEGLTPEIMAERKGTPAIIRLMGSSGFSKETAEPVGCSLGFLDFCRPRGEDSDYMRLPRRDSGTDILHV